MKKINTLHDLNLPWQRVKKAVSLKTCRSLYEVPVKNVGKIIAITTQYFLNGIRNVPPNSP